MPGPLAGLRVLDCTLALAGPYCGLVLADLGVDVIKIESPDPKARAEGGLAAYRGESGHFLIANRNKRGLTLDLKQQSARDILYRLVRTADAFIQNYRPGVMKRLGCDWETLRTIEPQGSGRAAYRAFKCADERWVNIGPSNRLWPVACRTLNVPELIDDPRFATSTLRVQNHRELSRLLQLEFLKHRSDEWIQAFQVAGIPVGPIKNVAEILDDPHVKAREMVVEVDHPVIGRMKTLGVPIKLSETPGAVSRAAPTLGQHSDEILCEIGYSSAEIADFHAAGVV